MKLFICILSLITTLCHLQSVVFCQSNNETNIAETTSTGPLKNNSCEKYNNDCKACVAYSECYYCDTDNKCHYKLLDILTDSECEGKKIHYLTCRATVSAPVAETTTVVETTSTGPLKNNSCEKYNNDCKACVAYSECYYCDTDNKCHYKLLDILTDNECEGKKIHYLTCRVNFLYLMIGVGVLILIAFLIIVIFCCYCCCKKKGIKISKDDLKWARQRQERKEIALEKRKERAERTEEIRKKYGLVKDSNPYQRFDA